MDITVNDAPDQHRFEARADGRLAGFVTYVIRDGLIVFPHTEVDPAFEGKGVGGTLARAVLDEAGARGLRVRALCPFIADWIDRHPEYQQLTVSAGASRTTG
jgi:uncharacterized protein